MNSSKSSLNQQPLVSIRCLVYNHEPFLRDCLEGFVMQQTNFPFEAIVHDDASTDHSADIIREYAAKYPHIIKPLCEKENQYSKKDGSLRCALDEAMSPSSKYVAYCEGDDYWTDPQKLQKQVDFMESHPEYSMCCAGVVHYKQSLGVGWKSELPASKTIDVAMMIESNPVPTQTALLRRELWEKYYRDFALGMPLYPMGDYPLWLWMAKQGAIYCFNEWMGCYRELEESASHSRNPYKQYKFALSTLDIKIFFCKEFARPRGGLWWERTRYVISTCIRQRWMRALFRDLLFPNVFRNKVK